MNTGKYNDKELAIIQQNPQMPTAELAKLLNRSYFGVLTKRRLFGQAKVKNLWTKSEIETLSNNYLTHTSAQIGEMIGKTTSQVCTKAIQLGLKIKKQFHVWKKAEVEQFTKLKKQGKKHKEIAQIMGIGIRAISAKSCQLRKKNPCAFERKKNK